MCQMAHYLLGSNISTISVLLVLQPTAGWDYTTRWRRRKYRRHQSQTRPFALERSDRCIRRLGKRSSQNLNPEEWIQISKSSGRQDSKGGVKYRLAGKDRTLIPSGFGRVHLAGDPDDKP
ncbi:hypothetical protein ES705_22542 [subsurface metagenome]